MFSRYRYGFSNIKTWKQFSRKVRSKGCNLLKRIDEFPDSVLVSGCQRSGTTMLARLITQNEAMVNYYFCPDDELAAALILSGSMEHVPQGRYCFQTTYLNECYSEYLEHQSNYRLIWMLRNPFSVVCSMTYNWKRFALNELFNACGIQHLDGKHKKRYDHFGMVSITPLHRACMAYIGKVTQLFELEKKLGPDRLKLVDYDELVKNKNKKLSEIHQFIGLTFTPECDNNIHNKSLNKSHRLSQRQLAIVEKYCLPVYEDACQLLYR